MRVEQVISGRRVVGNLRNVGTSTGPAPHTLPSGDPAIIFEQALAVKRQVWERDRGGAPMSAQTGVDRAAIDGSGYAVMPVLLNTREMRFQPGH